MPINGYFDVVFATSGTLTPVPDPVQGSGSISYTQGWTNLYSLPPTDPTALLVSRAQTNQLFNDVTAAIQFIQQNGCSNFITTAMNGGMVPYSYNLGAMVAFDAGSGVQCWLSTSSANTTTPGAVGASWQAINGSNNRTLLSGSKTYYVATTGNDSTGDGSVGNPWLTVQHAVNFVSQSVDTGGQAVTISVANGTYGAGATLTGPITGGGSLQIVGNTGSPSSCIISLSGTCFSASSDAVISVSGFKLISSGANGLLATLGGKIYVTGPMDYGVISQYQMLASDPGSLIKVAGNYTISGGATVHQAVNLDAAIEASAITVTLTGTPAFSGSYALAEGCGNIYVSGNTYSGSATGKRFAIDTNAVITTGTNTLTYLPGNGAGTYVSGGVYGTLSSSLQALSNLSDLPSLATALTNLGFGGSIGSAGWYQLPNGLIIQWGTTTVSIAPGGATATISYSQTYPNGVFATVPILTSVTGTPIGCLVPLVTLTSASLFTIQNTNTGGTATLTGFSWVSIGH